MSRSDTGRPAAGRLSRPAVVVALIVACAFFMENLDATIIVTALPQMARSFGVSPVRMSLGVTSYILALAACIPACGWLADRVGARTLFCCAIGVFTLASMVCGVAPSFPVFIGARIVQGAAAAMMSPVGRLVVLRNTEKKDLMGALSTLVWPALIAPVIGPPLGGYITAMASWRWIFYVNLPVGLLGIGLAVAFIPKGDSARRRPFDTAGFLLIASALAALTLGLDLIGGGGGDLGAGAALLALAAGLGALAVRHVERGPDPVLSLAVLRIRTFFVSSVSGGAITRATISATPFLLPLMFQLGFGLSPVASGSLLLIYMSANLAMKAVTNPLMRRFGLRNILIVNGTLASTAIAACALIGPAGALPLTGVLLLAAGASRSMQFTALTMITFADVPPEERASATVLSSLTQQTGMGMGVAVGALMLNLSQSLRHAPSLSLFDFRIALVLTGIFGLVAVILYRGLPPDAGDEISGHRTAA